MLHLEAAVLIAKAQALLVEVDVLFVEAAVLTAKARAHLLQHEAALLFVEVAIWCQEAAMPLL